MPKTGRPRAFDRDAAIIQAMHLFWEHGYAAASVQQLRDTMGGISAASFYAAFASKEALFREVVEIYARTHGKALAPLADTSLSPREAIEAALRASALMQTGTDHPTGCLVGLSPLVTGIDNSDLTAFVADYRQANRTAIRKRVEEAITQGILSAEAISLASLFDALLVGLSTQARDAISLNTMHRSISSAMRLWDVYRPKSDTV